jgi:DNA-binding MarR family transcriptional regulator/Holliday junction resolvase-like predicted endonuclease
MLNEQIKNDIRFALYEARLSGPTTSLTESELARRLSLEPSVVSRHCRFLVEEWAAERGVRGREEAEQVDVYFLTNTGIDEAEELLAESTHGEDRELVRRHEQTRKALLEIVHELLERFPAPHGTGWKMTPKFRAAYEQRIQDRGLDMLSADRNFDYLAESQCITNTANFFDEESCYQITSSGYSLLKEYADREAQTAMQQARIMEFEELKRGTGLTPQARGHALERLLKAILEEEGWLCELNVKTRSQENDLIIHQGREYFLVEAKWEDSGKASPEYISRLRDKVMDRPWSRFGIFVSMTGYTEGVTDSIERRMSDCLILLFSSQDVEDAVYSRRRFTDILDERFYLAMSRLQSIRPDADRTATPSRRSAHAMKKLSAK